jgi:hypothetical protein
MLLIFNLLAHVAVSTSSVSLLVMESPAYSSAPTHYTLMRTIFG